MQRCPDTDLKLMENERVRGIPALSDIFCSHVDNVAIVMEVCKTICKQQLGGNFRLTRESFVLSKMAPLVVRSLEIHAINAAPVELLLKVLCEMTRWKNADCSSTATACTSAGALEAVAKVCSVNMADINVAYYTAVFAHNIIETAEMMSDHGMQNLVHNSGIIKASGVILREYGTSMNTRSLEIASCISESISILFLQNLYAIDLRDQVADLKIAFSNQAKFYDNITRLDYTSRLNVCCALIISVGQLPDCLDQCIQQDVIVRLIALLHMRHSSNGMCHLSSMAVSLFVLGCDGVKLSLYAPKLLHLLLEYISRHIQDAVLVEQSVVTIEMIFEKSKEFSMAPVIPCLLKVFERHWPRQAICLYICNIIEKGKLPMGYYEVLQFLNLAHKAINAHLGCQQVIIVVTKLLVDVTSSRRYLLPFVAADLPTDICLIISRNLDDTLICAWGAAVIFNASSHYDDAQAVRAIEFLARAFERHCQSLKMVLLAAKTLTVLLKRHRSLMSNSNAQLPLILLLLEDALTIEEVRDPIGNAVYKDLRECITLVRRRLYVRPKFLKTSSKVLQVPQTSNEGESTSRPLPTVN